jgi:aminotransferase
MVTVGTSEAINVAIRTLVEPGDEVLIPAPSFAAYGPCTVLAAGKPVYVPIYEEDDFILRPDVLEKHITKKSKVLILPYPNNPTGAVMNRKQMEDIAIIVEENDLIVITDETYCELTYDVSHIPFATLPSMWDRTITINGLSQSYAMTGWRIGYIGAPSAMIAQMLKVHQYNVTCAAAMAQYAAINALETGDEDIEFMRETYNERRRFLISSLEEMGLKCFKPKGAFYAFPSIKNTGLSSEEFTKRLLLEAKVAVMPGNAFGENGQGYVRLAYATSMVDLEVAVGRMKKFMKNYLCKK